MSAADFERLLTDKRVVVCVGSGGVGKTTCSAAFGVRAALMGKRTLVLTIDPAKRLADALGLNEIGNQASRIDLSPLYEKVLTDKVPLTGRLSAMMLDMKQTFDDMVAEYSSPEERQRIGQNRLYKSMSQALAGIQEYMAVAKLYDVLHTGDYDLIVLDTPPTAHALDFLDAPARFLKFLDNDGLQFVIKTSSAASKLTGRLFDFGTGYIVRTLGKFVGIDVIREIGDFVGSFQPLFQGFRSRAEKIEALLASNDLGFIVVTAPTKPQVDEALFFERKLADEKLALGGIVINRTHPPLPLEAADGRARKQLHGILDARDIDVALRVGAEYNQAAAMEQQQVARLHHDLADNVGLVTVPELDDDVHDLVGLHELMRRLFSESSAA